MLSVSTLHGTLHTPHALDHFMQFVMEQHTEENLLFVLDAEEYHVNSAGKDATEMKKMAEEIYEKVRGRGLHDMEGDRMIWMV